VPPALNFTGFVHRIYRPCILLLLPHFFNFNAMPGWV
jgi:hypothetical protein